MEVAEGRAKPGGIRIDSGDLVEEAVTARAPLDERAAPPTRIVVSGDLDEFRIAELAVRRWTGTAWARPLVTGSGHPTAGFVYKLVAIAPGPEPDSPLVPVGKTSPGKATRPGRVWPHRHLAGGVATADVLTTRPQSPPGCRPLHVPLVRDGRAVYAFDLAGDRAHHQKARAELVVEARSLDAPARPCRYSYPVDPLPG